MSGVTTPSSSAPASTPSMDDVNAIRMTHFDTVLSLFPPGHLVDLGAGHGIHSRRAAAAGWRVTAVDARPDRFPGIQDRSDARITWVVQDVRTFPIPDDTDLVLCLGLFYHLTLDDQLDLLARVAGRPLVVDTHLDMGRGPRALSERQSIRGYRGSHYTEIPDTTRSSVGNPTSFWPTPQSFRRMLDRHGYVSIWSAEPMVTEDRTFHLAMPGPAARDWGSRPPRAAASGGRAQRSRVERLARRALRTVRQARR